MQVENMWSVYTWNHLCQCRKMGLKGEGGTLHLDKPILSAELVVSVLSGTKDKIFPSHSFVFLSNVVDMRNDVTMLVKVT